MDVKTKAAELQGKRIDREYVSKTIAVDEDAKTAIFVMSTASVDRHGDIVDQDTMNLQHFHKNPGFFWAHRANEMPLGKWLEVWKEQDPDNDGQMRTAGKAEFAVDLDPEIERAWKHVVRGDLNMVSIGFIPHVVEYDENKDAFILKECELLECSLVGVGANRHALRKENDIEAVREQLIDTKRQVEDVVKRDTEDPAANRRKNAIHLLNKAIRQFSK